MPPQKLAKYGHLVIVIHHCGFRITKELFLKRLKELTPADFEYSPWTIDDFLDQNREAILGHKFGKEHKKKLFPGFSRSTNLKHWDLNTYCFLLCNFCDLSKHIRHDIDGIRTLRNKLVHRGEGDIPDRKYQEYLDRITGIASRCTDVLGNPELKAELENVIGSPENVRSAAVEECEDKLKQWHLDESKYEVIGRLTCGEEIYDLKKRVLEKKKKCMEDGGPSQMDPLTITLKICPFGENKRAEEILTATHQDTTSGAARTDEYLVMTLTVALDHIKDDVRQTGIEVESDNTGSVMFNFTCFSAMSLIYLVDYISGPIMQRLLQDVAKAIEDTVDDVVTLQICIPPENYKKVMKQLEDRGSSVEGFEPQAIKGKLSRKVFNDPIYGQIDLHPLCVRIIDTPQFQILRHIKQLETVYLVYPGASHNRFEHSIGVCHLAGKFLRVLKERQPALDITTKDILCVEIAALCHDLGQGPFSHVFEHKFVTTVNPEIEWKHEKASVDMFEYMLEDNGGKLHENFRQMIPGFEERDIEFIKELIGVPEDLDAEVWPCRGRNKNKSFLYEVVANRVNGIDVDRWDYIARDSYMLGMKTTFEHNRLIQHARVLMAEGRRQICYRDKAAQDLYDMFYARLTLYRRAYQHKTHNIMGIMTRDALREANDHIFFVGKNGKRRRMSDAIDDMKAYTYLTDGILQEIHRSSINDLEKSRAIINRILQRDFYKCIIQAQVDVKKNGWIKKTAVRENLFNKINQKRAKSERADLSEILEIDVVSFDYGSKEKDPVAKVWFFKKGQEDEAIRINKERVSFVLPDTFAEQYIRVYCSVTDSKLFDVIKQSFSEWCKENNISLPQDSFVPLEDSSGKS
ncbi:deoxynucleoside triphosphate triphosphohydrolase SAMHD1-like [Mercenaria mercenaria]|uniref:deoxynucleoside triphosphate triphosphohydrolase SAMHD1-like n=1 Tax=Mercenaria mercenaria TaxID=6596 RepID=UPI00234F1CFF|nr:deoxynucleoside triphosphate triphosphohydrolase SAMHD1-like [Mercenaria mercenaria]